MSVHIEKFIIVNNYGTLNFGNDVRETPVETVREESGATGPVAADFVNGRPVGVERPNEAGFVFGEDVEADVLFASDIVEIT